jgi:TRAP-type C4-dicarboxylate transport system permease small subunit
MERRPHDLLSWARRGAEAVLAALLAAMFVAFLVQVFMRYAVGAPVAWTTEVSTLAWLWGVLWGAALVLRDEEEIRFDIVHRMLRPRVRNALDAVAAAAVVAVFAASLPAVQDYVRFMRIERSAYLGIRMDVLYAVYLVFAVAMIVRHAVILWRALAALVGRPPRR